MATAMWVPPCPLEVFRVSAFEVIANVAHRMISVGWLNEYADNDHARVMDLIMSGVTFFPERIDGIVVGTIGAGA